jgi:hypothetical protein
MSAASAEEIGAARTAQNAGVMSATQYASSASV